MMDFIIPKAYAALPPTDTTAGGNAFSALLQKIVTDIVQPIIYLLMALAIVYFVYGVMVFVQNADSPTEREKGYEHMKWGIIGIFIMVSAVGIMNLIGSTVGAN